MNCSSSSVSSCGVGYVFHPWGTLAYSEAFLEEINYPRRKKKTFRNSSDFSTGTETDFFAGHRACKCLEGFYRTHMFEKCHKCVGGLTCRDEYASLKSGYWWQWRNKTHKYRYGDFVANLLAISPVLGAPSVKYSFSIPTPYRCPREESCRGGLASPCENGYEGPLCQVCSSGYHKQLQTCIRCPSKKWIVGQLSFIAAIGIVITVVSLWTCKRKKRKGKKYPLIDMFFSKLKILIGFYQVTHGLLQAFS